jgi:hypothetical protein
MEIGVPGYRLPASSPTSPPAGRRGAFSSQVVEAKERELDQFVRVRLRDSRVATGVGSRCPISVHLRCDDGQVIAPCVSPAKVPVGPDGETTRAMGRCPTRHRCPDQHAEHEDWSGEEEQRQEQTRYSGYQGPSFCLIDKTRLLSQCYISIPPALVAIPNKSLKKISKVL